MSDAVGILMFTGLVLIVTGQIWLIILIMRGSPLLAFAAFLVPCVGWIFAVQNWDIARRPALCLILGYALFLGFGFVSGQMGW